MPLELDRSRWTRGLYERGPSHNQRDIFRLNLLDSSFCKSPKRDLDCVRVGSKNFGCTQIRKPYMDRYA